MRRRRAWSGDIPIRTGDRVTTSTVITTIDENAALEAYIQIPLDRSPDLRLGLPVQLLDGEGKVVATNPITFVAPRVDDATQTVLVKSALREVPPALRVQQFIRARVVWRKAPGLTRSDHRGLAHQRAVFLLRGRAGPATASSPGSGRCRLAN